MKYHQLTGDMLSVRRMNIQEYLRSFHTEADVEAELNSIVDMGGWG